MIINEWSRYPGLRERGRGRGVVEGVSPKVLWSYYHSSNNFVLTTCHSLFIHPPQMETSFTNEETDDQRGLSNLQRNPHIA